MLPVQQFLVFFCFVFVLSLVVELKYIPPSIVARCTLSHERGAACVSSLVLAVSGLWC